MTHRAESILSTIETLLTGLATTGGNITRARAWPLSSDVLPAITVFKSDDIRSTEDAIDDFLTRSMTVNIAIHVRETTNLETQLNQIAAEIFAAMAADKTLGLSYVFNALLIGDSEPIIESSQSVPLATMVSGWLVTYQHTNASAET